jgi:hypothetical protein
LWSNGDIVERCKESYYIARIEKVYECGKIYQIRENLLLFFIIKFV